MKTGTSLPATCTVGDMYLNLASAVGKNLYACTATNTWVQQSSASGLADPGANGLVVRTAQNATTAVAAPASTIVGTSDTQTLTNKSIDASEINTGVLSAAQLPAFSGDVTTAGGSTATTLASVNSAPGTYGDSSHTVQLTVDTKGRITAITQIGAVGGGGGSTVTTGLLASMPTTCAPGTLYFATDQPAGQQIYSCSSTNIWTQILSLGGSGALAFTNGSLDIVTAIVPRLAAANTFSGSNTFGGKTTFNQVASGTASNTDFAGQLTLTAGIANYSFAGQYTSAPICTGSDSTGNNAVKVTTTTTGLTLTGTGTDVINYICVARN
ncbi:MAG TPA: hypothetical protein VFA65_10650 [Bryobacteraceae bacterium]|nr:hypothetical protein [Bryobacteraceae bacterium]